MEKEEILSEKGEIRTWIEKHGGEPCVLKGVNEIDGDELGGILHICFEGEEKEVEKISWSDFFDRLENENLVLVYNGADPFEFSLMSRDEAIQDVVSEDDLPDSGDEDELKENLYSSEPMRNDEI